jgi:hypothetical protein
VEGFETKKKIKLAEQIEGELLLGVFFFFLRLRYCFIFSFVSHLHASLFSAG